MEIVCARVCTCAFNIMHIISRKPG
uniref:Uncharacterized protein n=1 Tax=Anguilla anguilla TaxID=7936 RepID=A0A0E9TZY2_ANGAN